MTELERVQDEIDALLGTVRGGWSDIVTKPLTKEARARERENIARYEAELFDLLTMRDVLRAAERAADAD
ncbi:hypothetical protein [Methylobacterium sp. E-046]|uniref:hypothetical protein n=1 Tax=Methylobacterium sp. E-046 TaxID=2836576 RepID=UPI001FBB695B|nr:hypothetical protein [Methylobacterium sp. E-046]MCJ2100271.1 hypothetical protein [Methylobacterium sp. E-046]